eukprot:394643-Amphidinium_carterae.1
MSQLYCGWGGAWCLNFVVFGETCVISCRLPKLTMEDSQSGRREHEHATDDSARRRPSRRESAGAS